MLRLKKSLEKDGSNYSEVDRFLSVLQGKSPMRLSKQTKHFKAIVVESSCSTSDKIHTKSKVFHYEFKDLLSFAKDSLVRVAVDARRELIDSCRFLCAVSYRKSKLYQNRQAVRRQRSTLSQVSKKQVYQNKKQSDLKARKQTQERRVSDWEKARIERLTYQYDRDSQHQTEFPDILAELIHQEDRSYLRTDRGRLAINSGRMATIIDNTTDYQWLRLVSAILYNEVETNILDKSDRMAVVSQICNHPNIGDYTEAEIQRLKKEVRQLSNLRRG